MLIPHPDSSNPKNYGSARTRNQNTQWNTLLPRQKQSPVVASHLPAALSSCPLHWQGRQPAAVVALPQLPGAQLAQAGPAVWCSHRSQRPRPWLHRLCWWQPQSALQSLPVQPTSHSHCITTCDEIKINLKTVSHFK
jgi:hypothetical protein